MDDKTDSTKCRLTSEENEASLTLHVLKNHIKQDVEKSTIPVNLIVTKTPGDNKNIEKTVNFHDPMLKEDEDQNEPIQLEVELQPSAKYSNNSAERAIMPQKKKPKKSKLFCGGCLNPKTEGSDSSIQEINVNVLLLIEPGLPKIEQIQRTDMEILGIAEEVEPEEEIIICPALEKACLSTCTAICSDTSLNDVESSIEEEANIDRTCCSQNQDECIQSCSAICGSSDEPCPGKVALPTITTFIQEESVIIKDPEELIRPTVELENNEVESNATLKSTGDNEIASETASKLFIIQDTDPPLAVTLAADSLIIAEKSDSLVSLKDDGTKMWIGNFYVSELQDLRNRLDELKQKVAEQGKESLLDRSDSTGTLILNTDETDSIKINWQVEKQLEIVLIGRDIEIKVL